MRAIDNSVVGTSITPCRRVCEVELLGNKQFVLRQKKYKVSEQLKTGEATTLFGECELVDTAAHCY